MNTRFWPKRMLQNLDLSIFKARINENYRFTKERRDLIRRCGACSRELSRLSLKTIPRNWTCEHGKTKVPPSSDGYWLKGEYQKHEKGNSIQKRRAAHAGDPGVYVIRSGVADAVKIGKATSIHARLKSLQTANPEKLELIAILSNDPEDEKRYHRMFEPYHLRGEWFRFEGLLKQYVESVRLQGVAP